ncbi:hypothetical protein [Phenylobacterium sp.]|uniref:hypothetical protein n=1 Tax=Phenylobacterium sp. TaxID=1871053 RepID=UPI00301C9695
MDRRAFLLAGLSLSACATLRPPAVSPAPEPRAELEPLQGFEVTRAGLVVRVRADGCTPAEDYVAYVDRTSRPATLAIARRRLRPCPPGAGLGYLTVTLPWSGLGLRPGEPVLLLNPVAAVR